MLHRRLALARDSRGTSAVEFALIAPFLAVLVMGIADSARGLARKFEIEQASYRALELVTVGSIQSDYDYAYIEPEAANAAGEPVENVEVEAWLECDGARQTDANFNTPCDTDADGDGDLDTDKETARFVQVTIHSDFQPTFPLGPLAGNFDGIQTDGSIRLTARSTLRVQ